MTPTPWSTMIRQEHVSWSPSSSSSSCFQSVFSTAALNYILLEEVVEEVIMMKTEKPRDIIITDKTDKDKETGHHHQSIMKVSKKLFLSILHCFENLSVLWCPRLLRLTSEFNTSFDRISISIQYWNCLFTISGFPSVPPADSAWINYPGWAQVLWEDINWTSNGLQSYQIQLWSLLTILWIIECILSAGSQQSKDIKWAFYCLMLLP